MSINLSVVIDNDEAIKKFQELQKVAKTTTSNIVTDSERMDMAIRKFGSALASIGMGFSLQELARQVATVRGEFQQLEVAFATMLGNKAEADALMERVVNLAATTPFDLQGVAQGTKQLLAYGSTANEVTDEIKMLGNIAAGLSMPLGDLVYLFGTTRTQGRLFTQDLRQFMGRGIPLAEELAKQFGVTKDKVGELVVEGKVGFNEVNKALVAMTSEGGKFYNLMEEQSKTISGQMSNLSDSIQQMFNDIGKQSEGVISNAISSAAYLVENYEKVGKVLLDVIAVYGSYKAAVMIVNAVTKVRALYLATETSAAIASAIANKGLAQSLTMVANAVKSLNIAKYLTNPTTWAIAGVGALVFGTYKLITAKSDEEKATERVNKKIEDYNAGLEKAKSASEDFASVMANSNASVYKKKEAYDKLIADYPELLKLYDQEKIKLMTQIELETALYNIKRNKHRDELQSRLSELQGNYDKVVDRDKPEIWREMNDIKAELSRIESEEIQINFEFLSVDDKIKKYEEDLDSLNAKIAEYNTLIQQSDRAEEFSSVVKELEAEKTSVIKSINALKEQQSAKNTEANEQDIKALENRRRKAREEAHKADVNLLKSQAKDKLELLNIEKEEALKAIDERIKEETDKITQGYLEQQRSAVAALYNSKIDAEKIGKKQENITTTLSFDFKVADKEQSMMNPGEFIKDNIKANAPEITALFGDMRNKTSKDLEAIADAGEEMMKDITDPEKLEAMRYAIDQIRQQADKLKSPLDKLVEGFKELFNSEVGSENFYKSLSKIQDGLSAVAVVANGLDSVLDSLGAGGAMDGVIDGITAVQDAFDAAGKGAEIGSAFGPIGAAAGAAIGAVGSLVKSISQIHDKNNEKRIQRLQEQIESVKGSYDDLGRAVNKAHSTEAAELIEEQNKLLEQQKALVEQQIAEEEDKKDTDKGKIKGYEEEIKNIEQAIEDNAAKAKEALTGISFDGFYDSFVNTLSDMDSTSEDFAHNFEEYLRKAILSSLVSQKYKERINALYDDFAAANEDGKITEQELAELRAKEEALRTEMLKDRDELAKVYGWSSDSSSSSSSPASKGFQTMSQETGDELNGRFTDIQGKITEIRSFITEMMATGKMQYAETVNIRDIMIQLNGNVGDIKTYTKVLPDMLESINNMNKKLENL